MSDWDRKSERREDFLRRKKNKKPDSTRKRKKQSKDSNKYKDLLKEEIYNDY